MPGEADHMTYIDIKRSYAERKVFSLKLIGFKINASKTETQKNLIKKSWVKK